MYCRVCAMSMAVLDTALLKYDVFSTNGLLSLLLSTD